MVDCTIDLDLDTLEETLEREGGIDLGIYIVGIDDEISFPKDPKEQLSPLYAWKNVEPMISNLAYGGPLGQGFPALKKSLFQQIVCHFDDILYDYFIETSLYQEQGGAVFPDLILESIGFADEDGKPVEKITIQLKQGEDILETIEREPVYWTLEG